VSQLRRHPLIVTARHPTPEEHYGRPVPLTFGSETAWSPARNAHRAGKATAMGDQNGPASRPNASAMTR
jgi:hypothetical protein